MDRDGMIGAARLAMVHVMDLESEDRVLVVTDEEKEGIGQAFAAGAEQVGCPVTVYLLDEERRPLTELPADLRALLPGHDAVVNMFGARSPETPFRVQWLLAIAGTGRIRCGHGPGITEEMMAGPMRIDFAKLRRASEDLIAAFAGVRTVHITAPGGTDLVLDIGGRDFEHDSHITVETAGNLPCGEIYCAPVETGADGLLVIDGSIGDIGTVAAPLRIRIEAGRIVDISCDRPDLRERVRELTGLDEEASVIGELGIGLNPGAGLSGNMLEDEKAFRTAHIAFGNNLEMPGGRNASRTHRDFLFHRPTIEATYADGARRTLLQDGDIVIRGAVE